MTTPQQPTDDYPTDDYPSTDAGIATFGRTPSKKISESERTEIELRTPETCTSSGQQETNANASSELILPEKKFPGKTESDNTVVTGMDYKL